MKKSVKVILCLFGMVHLDKKVLLWHREAPLFLSVADPIMLVRSGVSFRSSVVH